MEARELLERYAASERDFRRVDLNKADLPGANLSGANLFWVDLSGANLRKANLSWADLREADLYGANLSRATLPYLRFCLFRHELTATKGQIQIGCEIHPTEWWLDNYVSIGKENNYSDEEIAAYGKAIKMCAEYFFNENGSVIKRDK